MNKMNRILRAGVLLVLCGVSGAAAAADNMSFTGTLVVKPPCVINNSTDIDVKFGDVPTNEVDGTQHKVKVSYSLDCRVATAANKTGLKLTISGTGAGFDNALETNFSDLGIKLLQGSTPLTLGQPLSFTSSSPPELYAVPVKRSGGDLIAGRFSAGATLTVEYQ